MRTRHLNDIVPGLGAQARHMQPMYIAAATLLRTSQQRQQPRSPPHRVAYVLQPSHTPTSLYLGGL